MKVKFTKNTIIEQIQDQPIKKRRWDRWIYLGVLLFLLLTFFRWLLAPWFFGYAHGVLLQDQHDVQFTHDVEIIEYEIKENDFIRKGDTLFAFKKYSKENHSSNYKNDSLQILVKNNDKNGDLIAIEAQIEKRKLFLKALFKRLNYWKSERTHKEKLVYLDVITPNELANVDRSIDDVSYEIATVKAELQALENELSKILKNNYTSSYLDRTNLNYNYEKNYYIAPVDGQIDRIIIPEKQICYRTDKVFSIVKSNYFVRAYIDVSDLNDFEVGDNVLVILPYKSDELKGKVNKIYAVSEIKDEVINDDALVEYKHGVAVEVIPASCEGWEKLKVSKIPIKIRKDRLKI